MSGAYRPTLPAHGARRSPAWSWLLALRVVVALAAIPTLLTVPTLLPPYDALLLDHHVEVPNLSLSRPVEPSTLSDRAHALLHDLRLVQYDFSVGERYATEEMFRQSPWRARRGVHRPNTRFSLCQPT